MAAAPTGHLRSGAAIGESGGKAAGKGKDAARPKPKPKPKTAPKAKTPLQEATAVSKLYEYITKYIFIPLRFHL